MQSSEREDEHRHHIFYFVRKVQNNSSKLPSHTNNCGMHNRKEKTF